MLQGLNKMKSRSLQMFFRVLTTENAMELHGPCGGGCFKETERNKLESAR